MSVHYLQNLQKSLQIQNPNVMSMKFKDKCDKQKHYTQLHLSNEKKWFSVQSSVDLSNVCVKKKNLTSNFRCWSKWSSTAFFQKHQAWFFHPYNPETPFVSAQHGIEVRCPAWSVWRIHTTKKQQLQLTFKIQLEPFIKNIYCMHACIKLPSWKD